MKYIKLFDNYTESINKYIVTYDLNNSVLEIINVGMYNTNLSPENFLNEFDYNPDSDESEEEQQEEYDRLENNFSIEKYHNMISTNAQIYINNIILPELTEKTESIKSLEVTGIYSPKSYNYGTDELNFDLTINKREIIKEISTMVGLSDFDDYLRENYSSRDGFISTMPKNLEEFDEELSKPENDDSWQPVVQYLNYLFSKCGDENNKIEKFDEWLFDNEIDRDYSDYQLDDE